MQEMDVGRSILFFFVFPLLLLFADDCLSSAAAEKETYYLGFFSPFPNPEENTLIPFHLSEQWQSAFQSALEVLNAENRSYQIDAYIEDSSCNWMKVSLLSRTLNQTNLIGIVGPACSGAALSALQYLDRWIPSVSFAATHESLSNRNSYPNFFRTVYGDSHQTLAIWSVMEKLDIRNATILCVKDYYSMSLASSIQAIAAERVSHMIILDEGNNSSVNADQIHELLNSLSPNDVIILSVPPLTAQDIWKIAVQVGKTSSPWWYLGTDGVTAFNPYADGSLDLVETLQGEIGLVPNAGDFFNNPKCQRFYEHWRDKGYPGLPVDGFNNSRSYVTHLIDTVTLYFEIVDALVNTSTPINSSNVLLALQGNSIRIPSFIGCTGHVEIDPQTGSRKILSDQPPVYDLVALVNGSWELRGRISNTTFVSFQSIVRPTTTVLANNVSGKQYKGLIAGLTLSFVGLIIFVTIAVVYYTRKRSSPMNFVRIRS